jgi:oligogalacturonide transport system substrate-binding protein
MNKKTTALLLCVIMLFSFTACSSMEITLKEDTDKTTIAFSWWGTDARHDYTMEAIKLFEEKYPNIKVKMEYTEWTGYDIKTDVKMKSNTEADVMQINFAWLNKYSADGSGFYDLNSITNLDLSNFDDSLLAYGKSNGVLNALPIALNSKVFLYNESIYKEFGLETPKTWEDLFVAASVMSARGVYPLELDEAGLFFVCVGYVEQSTGKNLFDSNNNILFSTEDVQQMIDFYQSMVEAKVVVPIEDKDTAGFEKGIYAGTVQWITNAEKYKSKVEALGNTITVGQVPILNGAVTQGWYSKPASMYAISKNTSHPEEAALLLDFLMNDSEVAKLQGMEKGVPVSTAAKQALSDAGALEGIQNDAQQMADSIELEIIGPYIENAAIQSALKSAIDKVLYGGITSDEAAKAALTAMQGAIIF